VHPAAAEVADADAELRSFWGPRQA
jgi:hypothetical protein